MAKFIYTITLLGLLHTTEAFGQSFQSLADSCYVHLEKQDSISFSKMLPQLYETYLRENDAYYPVSQELERLQMEDQSIRLLYLNVQKKQQSHANLIGKIRAYMDEIDERNSRYALSILKEYGWLTTDEVSEKANEGLFLIVQHCKDEETQSLCLRLLEEKLKDYPAERWHYAFLTDRFAMNQGREQTYGTQKIVKKGVPYVIPLKYPEKVDSLRAEMGLESLWEELNEEYGCDWSLEKYFGELEKIREIYREYCEKQK